MMQLSANEKLLFEVIQKGDTERALKQLKEDDVRVNCLDESGMTLLDQACYKANIELVRELLKQGADPNSNEHANGYTALMFAAISGQPQSPELCRLLLDAGAHSYTKNSINKNAAELAAFVGQNECVSVINTYISMDEIEKLVHPQGRASAEQFPRELCNLIHATTRTHHIHPVKIVLFVADNEVLMEFRKKYLYVVDRLFERQLRCKEPNEAMSIKLWLILCVLRETFKFLDSKTDMEKSVKDRLLLYVRFLLKMEPEDEIRPNIEKLLRSAIKGFPYHQSILFQMLVKAVSQLRFGERPGTYKLVLQALFGMTFTLGCTFCTCCGVPNALKRCPHCKLAYCGSGCQKLDWKIHKKCCSAIAVRIQKETEEHPQESPETLENLRINSHEDDSTVSQEALKSSNEQISQEAGIVGCSVSEAVEASESFETDVKECNTTNSQEAVESPEERANDKAEKVDLKSSQEVKDF